MYQRFFNLTLEPFGVSPDPHFFYATAQHREACASLYYAVVERRGFAALIAGPGLGKTSVIVHLLERLKDRALVAMLVHPYLDANNLLESILAGFGVEPHADPLSRQKQLTGFLTVARISGKTCVVVLDEAQNLNPATLEMIRMLSNFEVPAYKLIQFILVGQPALATLLMRPECEQIRQRINVVARLEPLQPAEVKAYIHHRLTIAGAVENPLTPEAVREVAQASGGVPRVINTLCFTALTLAFADSTRRVTRELVAEAVTDLSLAPAAAPATVAEATELRYSFPDPVLVASSRRFGWTPRFAALLIIVVIAGLAIWFAAASKARAQLATPSLQSVMIGGLSS